MKKKSEIAIIIPARLDSSRLPKKMIASILGEPLIVRVARLAKEVDVGDVYVASSDDELNKILDSYNIRYINTDPLLPSGTDRVQKAHEIIGFAYEYIINLQGDTAVFSKELLSNLASELLKNQYDFITSAFYGDSGKKSDPNVVKVVLNNKSEAVYFSRSPIPYGTDLNLVHIGIYGYRKNFLNNFVLFQRSDIEKYENLEQLRAISNGVKIKVLIEKNGVMSIDTENDLKDVIGKLSLNTHAF